VSRNASLLWTLLHWWRQLSCQDGYHQNKRGFLPGNDGGVNTGKILGKQCVTFLGVLTRATIGRAEILRVTVLCLQNLYKDVTEDKPCRNQHSSRS
jgi:hypothetical protein